MGDLFANPLHLIILLVVVLIIFGPGKLPGVGAALGKSVREFKKATVDPEPPAAAQTPGSSVQDAAAPESLPAVAGMQCPRCGHENDSGARFCGACGASLVIAAEPVADEQKDEPVSAAPPLRCPGCDTENPPGNQFCAHCGKLLEHALHQV